MFDTHFDLLTKLYISYKRNDFEFIEKWMKNYNFDNVRGLIANLCFMSKEEMKEEYDINYYHDGDSVIDIFRISMDLLKKYIPKGITVFASIEGCDYLEDENDLVTLKELGLNSILPVWNCQNKFGSGNRSEQGLTLLGEKLIEKAALLDIGIDLSHANEKTFWDIINYIKKHDLKPKIYASHSNVRCLCDRDRNLKDEQILAITSLGGFVGVMSNSGFVVKNGYSEREKRIGSYDYDKYIEYLKYQYIKHIIYINKLTGKIDNICLSTDDMSFCELDDYKECSIFEYTNISKEIEKKLFEYYNEEEVRKIMYENAIKYLNNNINLKEKKDNLNFLNDKINDEVQNKVIPGMTYAIVKDNKIDVGSSGYKELVPAVEQIEDDTIYDIASLTKVIVTVPLICKLIDIGKLNFNDQVKNYLPNFKYEDVTIYHLLTHTSGLPADLNSKQIISKEKMMNKIYSMNKEYETGTKVVYSDLGYILLGEIIEQIYDNSLDVIAKNELFIPLEMFNTCYNPKDKNRCAPTEVTEERGILRGKVHDEKAYSLGGIAGHAGVFSTASDLGNYVSMILNNGIFNGKKILSKKMIDMFFKPLVYDEKCKWNRSFCFIVGNNDIVVEEGENVISFNGFTGPSISIDKDNNLGIVLMTNRVHPNRENKLLSKERPIISDEIYKKIIKNNSNLKKL